MIDRGRAEPSRFPALDPEPSPHSARWRLGAAAASLVALAAMAAIVWLVVSLVSGAPSGKVSVANGQAGGVLFMSSAGGFGLASPDGDGTQTLPALGTHAISGGTNATPSLDGSRVVAGDGTVLDVSGRTVARLPSQASLATQQQEQLAYLNPFTDGDRDLVILTGGEAGYPVSDASVSLVRWQSGARVASLGTADQNAGAAGDPQSPGVFVAVSLPASSEGEGDSRVELRDVARPPVVLATAASVDRALGQPAKSYFVLSPYPDPAGDKIAIAVNTSQLRPQPSVGVIVVSRAGHLLATLDSPGRPQGNYGLRWSPNGETLLYVTQDSAGQAMAEWTPGSGSLSSRRLPDPGDTAGTCVWSPDGADVLCGTVNLQSRALSWVSGSAQGGPLAAHSAPGTPIEFLMTGR